MFKNVLRSAIFSLAENVCPENVTRFRHLINARSIHVTSMYAKKIRIDRETIEVTNDAKKVVLEGEHTFNLSGSEQSDIYPDEFTPIRLFNGIPYKDLPVINVKATPNNTIMNVVDGKGKTLLLHSAGVEGFKNAKKGTNIAAQQAGITLGSRALSKGVSTVKLRVQGIGAGRTSAIKGIQMAGVKIVSITDDTRITWTPLRPRKQRRI